MYPLLTAVRLRSGAYRRILRHCSLQMISNGGVFQFFHCVGQPHLSEHHTAEVYLMAYDEFQTDCMQNASSDFHPPPPTTHKPFTAWFSLSQVHHSSEVRQLTEQLVLRPHNPQRIHLAIIHNPLKVFFKK